MRVELRQLPVFVQRLGSNACPDINEPITVELLGRSRSCFLLVQHLIVIGHIAHPNYGSHDVGPFVRTVQGSVAVMIELHASHHAPLAGEAIGCMQAARKINEESRADEFIVDIVSVTVFVLSIADSCA